MSEPVKLNHPWMVAVWPGMGHVALNAGFYLLAKLGMHVIAEFEAPDLFDVDAVAVNKGLIQAGTFPRNRFFAWTDPNQKHDLVVFIGEAQPPVGKYVFCRKLIEYTRQLGIERVFTFAAMATQMHPAHASRVFGAASNLDNLEELKRLELEILEDGNISGLNGVLLGAAAEAGLNGACLLGEMPHIFSQLPFPKASLAILEVFATMTGVRVDFTQLKEEVEKSNHQLGALLEQVEQKFGTQYPDEEGATSAPEQAEEETIQPADRDHIEALFTQAEQDRSKAFALKQELDRLNAFREYEDRFLDLFKKRD